MKSVRNEASDLPTKIVNERKAGNIVVLIKAYNSADVFNADKAGIFY